MNAPLIIALTLEQMECLRGESLFFQIKLQNTSDQPLPNFPTLDPYNGVLELRLKGPGGRRTAGPLSADIRAGRHWEPPRAGVTTTLGPHQTLETRGDLLEWLGELAPGEYEITVAYTRRFLETESKPVKFRVLPAAPVFSDVPRPGQQAPFAPPTAAWVNRDQKDYALFYQRQHPFLPRVPVRDLRVATIDEPVEVRVAATAYPTRNGHVLWVDQRGKLFLAQTDVDAGRTQPPVELKTPFGGKLLLSALTQQDGTVWIPWAETGGQRVAFLLANARGLATTVELKLETLKPLGPCACQWEYGQRLHFVWTTPGGREVRCARLALDDPGSGFVMRTVATTNDPIIWLEAYLDTDAAMAEHSRRTHSQPEPPPDQPITLPAAPLKIMCVAARPGATIVSRISTVNGQTEAETVFNFESATDLRVIASAMTERHDLALVLADKKDQLYYASTQRHKLVPLNDAAGAEVTLGQFPGLLSAAPSAEAPWVYLRYVEKKAYFTYVPLEPADMPEPDAQ